MQNLLKEIPQNLFDQIQNDVSLNFFMEKVKETLESLENQNKKLKKEISFLKTYKEQAIKDSLTKLYTRRYFEERCYQEIYRFGRTGEEFAIAFLDIDDFKQINDTFGHSAGDIVLKTLSEIILKSIRKSDIACRYGGEEFVILLANSDSQSAEVVLSRIKDKLTTNTNLIDRNLKITFSAGISTYSNRFSKIEELIEDADKKLYKAKRNGKNQFII